VALLRLLRRPQVAERPPLQPVRLMRT